MPRNKAASKSNKRKQNNNKQRKKQSKPRIGSKGHSRAKGVSINRKMNMAGRPVTFSGASHSRFGNGLCVRGSDFVGTVSVTNATLAAGSKLLELEVCPSQFVGTRIAQISPLFERFKIRSWTFTFEPAVASTQPGQLLMLPEYDPEDAESAVPVERLRQGTAHMGSQLFNVYSRATVKFVSPDPFTDLFTDGSGEDQRLTIAGLVRLYTVTDFSSPVTLGSIHTEYEIEFYIPQLQTVSQITDGDPNITQLRIPTGFSTEANAQIPAMLTNSGGSQINIPLGNVLEMALTPAVSTLIGTTPLPVNNQTTMFARVVPNSNGTGGLASANTGQSSIVALYRTFSDAVKAVNSLNNNAADNTPFGSDTQWRSVGALTTGTILGAVSNLKYLPISQYQRGLSSI